ncbi:hypothetical protein MW887_004473 [Aspergillus wentii]|nr:hypothetical protein MW887_004473 [Aspergillus wentii]
MTLFRSSKPTKNQHDDMAIGDAKPEVSHSEYTADERGIKEKGDYSGAQKKTNPVEIRLVRKLDMWIMPTLWLMYWLNYLDRNAIALARLNDLEEDLNLSSSQYQTCVSILFVGYLLGQVPSSQGLQSKGRLGALYMLSIFYTRKEIATRISVLYTGNILATAFAGLIAAGIFHGMDNLAGISGWQWLFILQGAVTFLVAIGAVFTLPDDPRETRWLTPEERQLAHERIVADTVDARHETSTFSGLKEAARDPKLWLFAFMQHMHLAANGFKNFFPTAVETLGFNTTITLVLTCPPYLIAGIISVFWSWSSGKYNERTWHITSAKAVAIVGFVLGCATLNTGARYFAMVIFSIGTEKKAASLAIVNTIANVSFVWTPYLWPSSDGPRYTIAMSSSAAFSIACAMSAWVMRFWLIRANKEIRQMNDESVLYYAY